MVKTILLDAHSNGKHKERKVDKEFITSEQYGIWPLPNSLQINVEKTHHFIQCITEPCCIKNSWSTERRHVCWILSPHLIPHVTLFSTNDAFQIGLQVELAGVRPGHLGGHTTGPFLSIHRPAQRLSK
jgi:hypothetical protein